MHVLTKWLRLESRGFRYKVALYLNNLNIRFADKKLRESLRISSIFFDSPASKVELTSRFGFICSQISQLLRLVTQIYGNERTCDKQKYADDGTLICRSAKCLLTFQCIINQRLRCLWIISSRNIYKCTEFVPIANISKVWIERTYTPSVIYMCLFVGGCTVKQAIYRFYHSIVSWRATVRYCQTCYFLFFFKTMFIVELK